MCTPQFKNSNTLDLTRSHHYQRPRSYDHVPRQGFILRDHVYRVGTKHPNTRCLVPSFFINRLFEFYPVSQMRKTAVSFGFGNQLRHSPPSI
ncbi:hypothetical protein C1H46_032898 [Malus baccata]|uniref:Uncharacterized protein n=1 Tax=Malus baccata TaxID=106549 RepID=A0A540L506_MALBA|nr:hypothetical protein C1H46_032898 [Malus baccata]